LIGFIGVTLGAHVLVIIVRIIIHHYMFLSEDLRFSIFLIFIKINIKIKKIYRLRPYASVFSNVFMSFINLMVIVLIDKIFEKIAKTITRWGNFLLIIN